MVYRCYYKNMGKIYYVYILTNKSNRRLYVGFTDDVTRRTWEHIHEGDNGFAGKYKMYKLVYVEESQSPNDAIAREKQLKGWSRNKKYALIKTMNKDLHEIPFY